MNKGSISPVNDKYNTFAGQFKAFTSLSFGQLVPQMCHELLSRDSWRVSMHTSLDIAPMSCKTFADIYYNQSAFYVGLNQLDKDYSSVRAGMTFRRGRNIRPLAKLHANSLVLEFLKELYYNPSTCAFGYDYSIPESERLVDYKLTFSGFTPSTPVGTVNTFAPYPFSFPKETDKLDSQRRMFDALKLLYPTADLFIFANSYTSISGDTSLWKGYVLPVYLNRRGSFIRKIFNSLGYQLINPFVGVSSVNQFTSVTNNVLQPNSSSAYISTNIANEFINPYPILAYLKIYSDYFLNAAFADGAFVSVYLDMVYNHTNGTNMPVGNWDLEVPILDASSLVNCFRYLHLSLYRDDVTDATLSPFNPSKGLSGVGVLNSYTGLSLYDGQSISVNKTAIVPNTSVYGSYRGEINAHTGYTGPSTSSKFADDVSTNNLLLGSSNNYQTSLNSYLGQRLLDATAKFLLKSKIAGTKVADRLRVFFGISEPFEDLQKAKLLGMRTIKLNVSGMPIQSNVYNGVEVQNEAGEKIGMANAEGNFSFTFRNDFGDGIGIVVNWLNVRTIYLNRTHRLCLKDSLNDYYNGALDGQGFSQMKSLREVCASPHSVNGNTVFGFEPLYEDYRRLSIDFISGDILRLPSLRPYLLPRTFENEDVQKLIADSSSVLTTLDTQKEYDSLFVTQDGYDPILVCSDVQVVANRCVADSVHALGLDTGQINIDTLATEID